MEIDLCRTWYINASTETQGNVGVIPVTIRSNQGNQESECHPQGILAYFCSPGSQFYSNTDSDEVLRRRRRRGRVRRERGEEGGGVHTIVTTLSKILC